MRFSSWLVAAAAGLAASACLFGGGSNESPAGQKGSPEGIVPETASSPPAESPKCPPAEGYSVAAVHVELVRNSVTASTASFGLPLPPGAVRDAKDVSVLLGGEPIDASVRVLLEAYGPDGAPMGPRSLLVQLPAAALQGDCTSLEVRFQGGSAPAPTARSPYRETSVASNEVVRTSERTVETRDGKAALVESSHDDRLLFAAREPAVLAMFPDGYLAATGLFGHLVPASGLGADLAGLKFISDEVTPFGLSAMFLESYALNPDAVVGPDDLDEDEGVEGFEAWLYDRCATFLVFAAHTGDSRFLREGFRSCSYYADKIELNGENRGIFKGKPEPDPKYSHLRGLYAYYGLTGDEAALAAGTAIAEMWLHEENFVVPYLQGRLRGPDKLWTERLLGTSFEGLYYGHLLTGGRQLLDATRQMLTVVFRHVTGDKAAIAAMNPGATVFPPQDCFIHTAEQAAEGKADEPWCSGWMPVLLVDSLLAYQDQTGDPRVDEVFIRLARFLRDTGTSYLKGDLLEDSFLKPSAKYDPAEDLDARRVLVPLYGAGVDARGRVRRYGEYDDTQHCLDATALTAAALRSLKRTGEYDQRPVAPFASEGESILALHEELAFCAYATFVDQTRPKRDPANFAGLDLSQARKDPQKFIEDNKIGYPSHNVVPQRKLSWWFNTSLEQFALLREAGIAVPELRPGTIQP